jgi:hypothetical protein
MLLPWLLWKHRNSCVFEGLQPSNDNLMNMFKEEESLWAQAAALGLRAVLPATWDIHS